jgi:hypothetical protein
MEYEAEKQTNFDMKWKCSHSSSTSHLLKKKKRAGSSVCVELLVSVTVHNTERNIEAMSAGII